MPARKSIGIPPGLYARPLLRDVQTLGWTLTVDAPSTLAIRLRQSALDVAMISPVEYAREGSLYRILRAHAISSRDVSNAVMLQFRQGIRTIKSLAVRPNVAGDIILAKIILMEEFGVAPVMVPVDTTVHTPLDRADAALITGDDAYGLDRSRSNAIDLVEAWSEMTGLPYVHGIFCFHDGQLSGDDLRAFRAWKPVDDSFIESIIADAMKAQVPPAGGADALRSYLSSFTYDLTDDAEEGMREFLKYAYYHGVIPDVPELNFDSEIESFGKDG